MTGKGVRVARMPRPAIQDGAVLVRVRYSLISTGTELAGLRGSASGADASAPLAVKARAHAGLAKRYLRAALKDPRAAAQRAAAIAREAARSVRPAPALEVVRPSVTLGSITWTRWNARSVSGTDGATIVETDASPGAYQATSQPFDIPAGRLPIVRVAGLVEDSPVTIGLLNESGDAWLGSRVFEPGPFSDRLIFSPGASSRCTLVIAGGGEARPARLRLDVVEVTLAPPAADGLPHSELDDQGWNVGYSAAGEVVAVGAGVTDLSPGDLVACAGAGYANHAEYVSVPRNLVCRVPPGCTLEAAATATVGAIALQGIRRARLELGERVAVLGLGLIGQITMELARAAGCSVIGMDLDAGRLARARSAGMEDGASSPETFSQVVRDATQGRGADKTIITAATKSDAVINLAMDVTRAKGTVVIVGDVGLNVNRAVFYRKEIDLLMSTSYGPGRYDAAYEVEGRDYPFAYVRWTLNRNLQAYLDAIAARRINVSRLIDRTVSVEEAPAAYAELAREGAAMPLGVVVHYPDDTRDLPEPGDAASIRIRGARRPEKARVRYALVGAGAFGTGMLVPQMNKRRDVYFLRAVVSRNTTQGGNFARANQVEVLATELGAVTGDPELDLLVVATRHHEHAAQVVEGLSAGKHVFVEKPLALTWDELDRVVETYEGLADPPLLMVGFNRRFSPALQQVKALLANRRSPLVVHYRVNGGYIPLDHWVHGPQGGGRNIGEACHMYDVFRFLTGAPVVSIHAAAIQAGDRPYLRTDNFAATMRYEDGSVCNLVYTALGPKQGLPKERIEVFADGDAFIVDDFKSLIQASTGAVLWQAGEADKGHFEELNRLADALASGGESPIPFEELIETSAVALQVEEALRDSPPAAGA